MLDNECMILAKTIQSIQLHIYSLQIDAITQDYE